MSFMQPWMLWAAPFIALPIVIHLINQRRYQSMRWGAMQFLLTANKMSRGYARLRQWLILACRTLAVAGLILAASRPLSSGLFGSLSGTQADTTIVILDRSPSMQQQRAGGGATKLETATQQLVETLRKLGSARWVLIESNRHEPHDLESIDALLELPEGEGSSASADLPAMLASAAEYIHKNSVGRTEVWICSDSRTSDWRHRSPQWQTIRDQFLAFPQSVRFHLLAFPDPAPEDIAIEVLEVERVTGDSGSELSISLRVTSESDSITKSLPIQFEIAGATSQTVVELVGREYELRGHRIPIESSLERGWGKVSVTPDINQANDSDYFAFDKPQPRKTVLVLEDAERAAPLLYAAEVPPSSAIVCQAEVFPTSQLDAIAWEEVSLLIWQAPLPQAEAAALVQQFVGRGGRVVFFPPNEPGREAFESITWAGWKQPAQPIIPTTWRTQQDLLANTQSGAALPVGELQATRYCPPVGDLTPLATLDGGDSLLSRLPTSAGGIYFCSTTPYVSDSNLASNGIVLYVAVQRALAEGASSLGQARQVLAGAEAAIELMSRGSWQQKIGDPTAISTEFPYQAGVYQADVTSEGPVLESAGPLLAIRRDAPHEDHAAVLSEEELRGLFDRLDFTLMTQRLGESSQLVQEIWRAFLLAMMLGLLIEAFLCMPRLASEAASKGAIAAGFRPSTMATEPLAMAEEVSR